MKAYGKKLLVAFVFAAVIDGLFALFRVSIPFVSHFDEAIVYGVESVNVMRFGADIWHRLDDRYHWRAGRWGTPFNLTIACRDKGAGYESIASLCVQTGRPAAAPGVPDSLINMVPMRPVGTVDDYQYPRRAWLEMPMGLPDAVMHVVRCAWNGVDLCNAATVPAVPRTNWLGRGMLIGIAVLALFAAAPDRHSGWSVPRFVAAFVLGLMLWSILALVGLIAFRAIAWVSHGLSHAVDIVVAWTVIRPVAWIVHAVKDVAADRAKGTIEHEVP